MSGGNNTTEIVFKEEIIKQKYQQCMVQLDLLNQTGPTMEEPYCKGVFDGWACWPDTPAGTVAFAPCPEFITGFDPNLTAHKLCTINGTWFKHPISGLVWSNYTTCVNMDDLNWSQKINTLYETGYAISLVALLLSLVILSYFKSLRCPRITLHMNLFTSFAINNLLWLLWYRLIVPYPEVVKQNGVWCQCLHVVLHYFLLTNYSWMFGEGFYLHTLLVSAFISEERLVKWLTRLAWIIPFIFITIYVKLRIIFGTTDKCWIEDSPYVNVLTVLVCCSMVLNLIFLCNIVRVLLTKLRSTPSGMASSQSSAPSRSLLQALRATLLLLPLLGLNYLVTPFRPYKGHPWEKYYELTSAITASFQGLCVATLFCFCNGEVIAQVKRRWQYIMFRPRANSYTATTVSKKRSWNGEHGMTVDYPSMNQQSQVNNCLLFVRSTACPNTGEDNV